MKVSQIASQLGLCRRRIDKWIQLDELSERNRMQPRPGMPESFRDYLRQRWEAGCRHGRTLLSDSKLNATESPKLFATEKKSHDIIVLLLE